MGDLTIEALIDSGASRSLIREDIYRSINVSSTIKPLKSIRLFDVQNRELNTLGVVYLPFLYDGKIYIHEFIVTNAIKEVAILGLDAIIKHKITIKGTGKKAIVVQNEEVDSDGSFSRIDTVNLIDIQNSYIDEQRLKRENSRVPKGIDNEQDREIRNEMRITEKDELVRSIETEVRANEPRSVATSVGDDQNRVTITSETINEIDEVINYDNAKPLEPVEITEINTTVHRDELINQIELKKLSSTVITPGSIEGTTRPTNPIVSNYQSQNNDTSSINYSYGGTTVTSSNQNIVDTPTKFQTNSQTMKIIKLRKIKNENFAMFPLDDNDNLEEGLEASNAWSNKPTVDRTTVNLAGDAQIKHDSILLQTKSGVEIDKVQGTDRYLFFNTEKMTHEKLIEQLKNNLEETVVTINHVSDNQQAWTGELKIAELGKEEGEKLLELINKFKSVVATSNFDLGSTEIIKHTIDVQGNPPIRLRPYRPPFKQQQEIE